MKPSARQAAKPLTAVEAGSRLVYSTDAGRVCPDCGQPKSACACRAQALAVPAGDGNVRVALDTKGRHGKAVTTVRGVPLAGTELDRLAKTLRTACGCGGTVKAGTIELQGDQAERAIDALRQAGYTVRAGAR